MADLRDEVLANYHGFTGQWPRLLESVRSKLVAQTKIYEESYLRITSLQAWRSELLDSFCPGDALEFFCEAQNDAVLSHALASMGIWRSALSALRSLIENSFRFLYYKDHPVELIQWRTGVHQLSRVELSSYCSAHPSVKPLDKKLTGLQVLFDEYSTLNLAVHASAKGFRMYSPENGVTLARGEIADRGKWAARERHVLKGVNLLLLAFFRSELQGASRRNLRKAISFAIPKSLNARIRSHLGVSLFS